MDTRKFLEPKQVLVVRKDLNMSVGKFGAQISHASLGALLEVFKNYKDETNELSIFEAEFNLNKPDEKAINDWLTHRFTKIVVYVKSEQALKNVYEKAKAANLPAVLIQDAGFTEFDEPTYTCVGIGPAIPDRFIGVTDKLRLFNGEIIPK
jgi:PTH2 family peptidyl-tRNA hydrolase